MQQYNIKNHSDKIYYLFSNKFEDKYGEDLIELIEDIFDKNIKIIV